MQSRAHPSSMPVTAAATITSNSGPSPPVFILDVGTRSIKAGLHTAAAAHETPSIVGVPRYSRCLPGPSPATASSGSLVVGQDARRQRGLLRLAYPIQHGGVVSDWDAAWPLLRRSVQDALATPTAAEAVAHALRDDAADVIYSLVEKPFASRPQRARLAERLFENRGRDSRIGPRAAGVFCGVGPLLALYATGQTTGLVLDVGDGGCSTAAAVDGYVVSPCLQHDAGGASGAAMTAYLTRLLHQSGVLGPTSAAPATGAGTAQERELVYDIKEACCAVSSTSVACASGTVSGAAITPAVADVTAALIDAARRQQLQEGPGGAPFFSLPDGQPLQVGAAEATQAAEVLFYPAVMGLEGPGVVDALLIALTAAPAEVQPQLLGNIVLTGGATCCPGFAKRVFHELQQRIDAMGKLSPFRGLRVCVTAPEHRAHAGWLGASFVAQLSTFASRLVVSRAAYEEEGEAALAKKVLS